MVERGNIMKTDIIYHINLFLWLVLDEHGAVLFEAVTEHEAVEWVRANRGYFDFKGA